MDLFVRLLIVTLHVIELTGSTLKCRNALGLDFIAVTHLFFSVALYILAHVHFSTINPVIVSFGF